MSKNIGTKLFILLSFAAISLCFPVISLAQELKNGETFWNWQTKPDQDNFQLNFQLSLKIKGKKVSGALVFSNLINGEWDDTDRSLTPFTGKIEGSVIPIEFDAKDTHNFEESDSPFDARFRKPQGTSVNRATIKITNGKFGFGQTRGKFVFDLPRTIIMRRGI